MLTLLLDERANWAKSRARGSSVSSRKSGNAVLNNSLKSLFKTLTTPDAKMRLEKMVKRQAMPTKYLDPSRYKELSWW